MPPIRRIDPAATDETQPDRQPLTNDATRWHMLRLVDVLAEIARNEIGSTATVPGRDGNAAGSSPAALRGAA